MNEEIRVRRAERAFGPNARSITAQSRANTSAGV